MAFKIYRWKLPCFYWVEQYAIFFKKNKTETAAITSKAIGSSFSVLNTTTETYLANGRCKCNMHASMHGQPEVMHLYSYIADET